MKIVAPALAAVALVSVTLGRAAPYPIGLVAAQDISSVRRTNHFY